MSRRIALATGVALLAFVWGGPLAGMAATSFAAHMLMHMAVVAAAAPLIGYGLAGLVHRYTLPAALLSFPMLASLLDLVVIWGWHTPQLHELARTDGAARAVEQLSFFIVGVMVWGSVLRQAPDDAGGSRLVGAGALFFTAMHMTMLGVLLALAPDPICSAPVNPPFGLSVMADQQWGGIIMLGIGGLVYTLGGLVLMAQILNARTGGQGAAE